MLNTDKIRLSLEQNLARELYDQIEGDILESVLKEARIEDVENQWKYILEGHSFKITEEMAPRLFHLFNEIKRKLEFDEPTDLFVTNSNQLNAFAISRLEDNQPHIININSGIIEKMDDNELMFIIGHEVGHLISNNARILKLVQFIFPDYNRMPLILRHKIELWQKLAELTADRFGFIANPNLEKCVSGFFKLASGLDTNRIKFDFNAYIHENQKILDFFKANKAANLTTHPINPIRIKSAEAFSRSATYKAIEEGREIAGDEALDKEIDDLTTVLMTLSSSELDHNRKLFLATGGLIMAHADKQMAHDEYERIIAALSAKTIFPQEFLASVMEKGDAAEVFRQSAAYILERNPSERYPMLEYLTGITLADRKILKEELGFLYEVGVQGFGFSRKEAAQVIAGTIHREFVPDMWSGNKQEA
ncbi:MAG: M48 family metallopeptidase [Bacteroidales bacterium]|nr:M48 family metallopeptidase [Bacteroidales bacterium]